MDKCKTHGKRVCLLCLWTLFTNTWAFPLEHALWEKAPLFRTVTQWFGL